MALGAPSCGQLWDLLVKNTGARPSQQLGGCPKGCSEVPQTQPRESGLREWPRPEPQRFISYLACGVELPGIFGPRLPPVSKGADRITCLLRILLTVGWEKAKDPTEESGERSVNGLVCHFSLLTSLAEASVQVLGGI